MTTKPSLELELAKSICQAARGKAESHKWAVSIAVVGVDGSLINLERLDGAIGPSAEIAAAKARTAAMYGIPSAVFEEMARDGRPAMAMLPHVLALTGGIPLSVGGVVVGGVGVSGMQADQDLAVAMAGAKVLDDRG